LAPNQRIMPETSPEVRCTTLPWDNVFSQPSREYKRQIMCGYTKLICCIMFWLLIAGIAPATDTIWTYNGSGNWTDATKWSNGEPNDSTVNAFIDDGDTAATVTLNTSRTVGSLSLGLDDILRIESTSTGGAHLTSANGFTNNGTIVLTSANINTPALSITSGILTNSQTGTMQVQSGSTVSRYFTGDLVNNGNVSIDAAAAFNKLGGQYTNNNQFTISSGGRLDIFANGTSQSGATFEQLAGTLNVLGGFNQGSGTFKYTGGVINGAPAIGGTLVIGTGITNAFAFQISRNSLDSSALTLSDNVLLPGQLITLQNTPVDSQNGFTNNGSLVVNGTGSIAQGFRIINGTLINDTSGTLDVGGVSSLNFHLQNDGSVTVRANATYGNWTHYSLTNNNQFSIAAGKTLNVSNGSTFSQVNGTLDVLGTLNLYTQSTFKYLGGTINGTVNVTDSSLIIDGGSQPVSFVLQNAPISIRSNGLLPGQSSTLRSTSNLTSNHYANAFTNYGSIFLTGTSSGGTALNFTTGTFLNAATGLLHFQTGGSGTRTLYGDFRNDGTVTVDRSTTFNKLGGLFTNNGQLTIASAQTLNVSNGTFEQIGGTTLVSGTFSSSSTAKFTAGHLTGTGTISAPVDIVGAVVEPGASVGKLTIQGTYVQETDARLIEEIGGTQTGKFDQLSATGVATLAGTLDVRLVDLGTGIFSPTAGASFQILTGSSVKGKFETLLLPGLSSNLAWKIRYGTNNVTLKVTSPTDFDGNGTTDSADYVVWRRLLGTSVTQGTSADADFDGQVTQADYDLWRARFSLAPGSGSSEELSGADVAQFSVAEPNTALLPIVPIASYILMRRKRQIVLHMASKAKYSWLSNT
jgi:hypothetical protein